MGVGKSRQSDLEADENQSLLNSVNGSYSSDHKDEEFTNSVEKTIRQPIKYHSINDSDLQNGDVNQNDEAVIHRYKYYNRLTPHSNGVLRMPDHVVPGNFTIKVYVPVTGKQNSIITIFSLWNTMMGTSLLSMPWAIKEAGFISGIILLLVMAGIMMYTCYRVQKAVDIMKEMVEVLEFSDVCKQYFGKAAEVIALFSSLTSLLGGMIVYWILMSNFLYHVVSFIFYESENNFNSSSLMNHTAYSDAVCPNAVTIDNSSLTGAVSTLYHSPLIGNFPVGNSVFDRIWDEEKTVPFFLIILMAPLVNFKSPTIFTKMNALGAVSVMYLFIFTTVKSAKWGIHIDFSSVDSVLPDYSKNFRSTFPALTGVSALAYFVQNSCISITRNQKNPKNNVRDIILAYILVAVSYVYIGSIFYSSYPLSKSCIQDNLLNNIETNDVMAFVARIGLFFQILCVFPLLIFIFRLQFLHYVFGSVWPSLKHVLVLNVVLIGVCIIFAIFLPHIGRIIGFVGAFCGFSFGICLPCLVYLKACHLGHGGLKLTWPKIIIHCVLILIGLLNFVGQFTIIGKTN